MAYKSSVFLSLIDGLIPPSILQSDNEDQQVRVRIVMGILCACAAIVSVLILVMVCISLLQIRDLWVGVIGALIVFISIIATIFFFRRYGKLITTVNFFAAIIYGSITAAVVVTGGWTSPVTFLLLSVPVVIFLVAGRSYGLLWSVITAVSYLVIYQLYRTDMHFVQVMHEENRVPVTALMWCLTSFIIVGCLALYDYIVDGLTSALREERENYKKQALFDPLTGVYNRDSFQKKLTEALDITRMSGGRFALLRFDIRNLKTINMQIDYASGDELVKKVANLVQESINRDNDNKKYILARFGSGEFSVLMQDIKDRGEIVSLASRIRKVLAEPVEISGDVKVRVQSSIGGVLAPDFSVDVRFLMRGAQDAMVECAEREEDFILR